MSPHQSREPRTQPFTAANPVTLPILLRPFRQKRVQITLTYLVNVFLERTFLVVDVFRIGIIAPLLRITDKNLKIQEHPLLITNSCSVCRLSAYHGLGR